MEKEKELKGKENLLRELQWCKEQQEEVDRAQREAEKEREVAETQRRNKEIKKYD